MEFIHRGPATRGKQDRFCAHQAIAARAYVDHQDARDRTAVGARNQLNGAMLFQTLDVARPDLLSQTIDDLYASEIAFVNGAVECLAGKRFLMQGAVWIAIEKAAQLVFELVN